MARKPNRARQARRAARLDFAAIEIVGALLAPELVGRIAAFDAPEQTEKGYGVPPGLKLRDEVARYYQVATALWERFSALERRTPAASEAFVLDLLRSCFGFDSIEAQRPVRMGERVFPVRHAALDGRVPIAVAPVAEPESRRAGVDEPLEVFGDGARRRSATQLLQEYLNAADEALWGLACDGVVLRLFRDNASLTRPAWIEVNLEKIFSEGLFADFSAFWLLIHQSRFGAAGSSVSDCPLERWRDRGRLDGSAAKEKLRLGVEAALKELGQGFIEHRANEALRQALKDGKLGRQGYFEELLRLVYRLIFLFAAEDRELLHAPEATAKQKEIYARGYGVGRLRERAIRRAAWDRHGDAWDGLRASFRALARGEPGLGLPALGGLFTHRSLPHLEEARIENRRLLHAVWRLAWFRPEGQPLTRVNWRDMETEELGSVYESLLELTPEVSADARSFAFAEGDATRGNVRKTSGSYYTPDSLVQLLLDTTLDPVLDAAEARNPADPAAEILRLSIIDPACGSGHFLLGAARRAAERIARHRNAGAMSQEVFQHALREVVSHCIYGVDRNPLAVELCRVALWIEALEPGKPLSFLDSRIRCGDSLIGVFRYHQLRDGLPDEAFNPLTGDDKEVAKAYQRLNKDQRDGKGASGFIASIRAPGDLVDGAEKILSMPEDTLDEIEAKADAFEALHESDNWLNLKGACDTYVAAFFLTKTGDVPDARALARGIMPLTETIWRMTRGEQPIGPLFAAAVEAAESNGAFHWPLEFPAVMARGGFDAVVGNPPWERIKLQEQEFFAARDPDIANARNKAERQKLIDALEKAEEGSAKRVLFDTFVAAKRAAEAASFFARKSGRFPLTGTGDVNTYALFSELFSSLARHSPEKGSTYAYSASPDTSALLPGRAGLLVPTGIATDSSTSGFFQYLIERNRLGSLFSFYEVRQWFRGTDDRKSFCILVLTEASKKPTFVFDIRELDEVYQSERRFSLSPEQISRINPNTRTAPVFRSRADAELVAKLYHRTPVLIQERPTDSDGDANPWGISFQTMFHMANDSGFFRSDERLSQEGFVRNRTDWEHENGRRYVPLYEAKMVHHFDHRWATYEEEDEEAGARDATLAEKTNPDWEPTPRYWVPEDEVHLRAARVPARLKYAWRKEEPEKCLGVLAEWVLGTLFDDGINPLRDVHSAEARIHATLGARALAPDVIGRSFANWLGKVAARSIDIQGASSLTTDDLDFLANGPGDPLALTTLLIDRKQPRWLMGWRDISLASVERTMIASVIPKVGTNHKIPLFFSHFGGAESAAFYALITSLCYDFVVRNKLSGTSLTYFYFKQFPTLPPADFSSEELTFISSRVLELTYTSHAMRPWAEDLGHTGLPFTFDPERRALLRAELDAFFARKYGLTRDELRYILDPADVKGPDYPSETFRVLKNKEENLYGEYRTQKLVLAAFDRLSLPSEAPPEVVTLPMQPRQPLPGLAAISGGAWARPATALPGDVGATLAAILKAMGDSMPIRDVRLAAALVLEPRLLIPLLSTAKASEWRRLVGPEADPLPGNVAAFAPRINAAWGNAVQNHRGNGRLIEDLQGGTWAPGAGLETIETRGWPDGRAGFVLEMLGKIDLDIAVDSLPDDIQRWVADAATA